jgi:hypothetical protein
MDLTYKISSVWLYNNQLNHDYIFLYNRKRCSFRNELTWDAPFFMFSSSDFSASNQIYNMDKNDKDFKSKSLDIMLSASKKEGIKLIKNDDFIKLIPIGEGRVSYSGYGSGELITDGEYKGLYKQIYTPYDIIWNETKSGINIFDFEVAGIWNLGSSQYSLYRIWEFKEERKNELRILNVNKVLDEIQNYK